MENALLIGLSRQMALGRELDVIANNMANVTTNGFKARKSRFAEYLMPGASADAFQAPDRRAVLRDRHRHAARSLAGRDRTHRQSARRRDQGRRLLRRADAGRRALHPQRRLRAQRAGPARHQRRPHRAGRSGPIAFGPQETGIEIGADGTVSTTRGSAASFASCASTIRRRCRTRARNLFSSRAAAAAGRHRGRLEPGAIERSNVQAGGRDEPADRGQPRLLEHRQHDRRAWTSCAAPRSRASPTG